ncbi:unnamed protein product [Tilletia laevis]|uniref:Uncharacterized protein n=3 Tax=Tilletia TaxID=13289 RepID=A0A9N8MHH9_9BASI|nr:hypothetical protein CF336_g1417 [Tilletia laevis]KAE8264244.1 hypothetical protein A4X03_0g1092 [Tilletia caries]CAD6965793.1 unnamed protein product [Tilletia laevis]CAD7066437.1 unnamed protein product [Tilletia caries]
MLDGYQPSVQGGLGLALTRELLYQQSRNNARSQSHYTPLGRDSSTVQRTLSSKEAHPRTHKSLSSRADLTKLPPLPSPPAHATPYQFSLAGNSTLSLNRDVITPSSTPSGWVETYHELGSSKGSAGLAGVPDEARSLLQRRSRKPLEIGLFQGSDKQDSANGQTAAVSTGWQSQGSTSMSAMVTSPKSPGSLRSPPPFPPPRMPLPAVPKSGSTHIPMPHTPMPTLLQPDTAGSSKTFYGKHSPLIGSAKLAATEVEGRSRSSSLDTPSAALYRRQGQASGRGRFDSGSACTFTPLTALPAPIRPPRAQDNVAYREHAPQVELAFLAKSSAAPFNATGSELGSLGKLRNDLNDYGRVSLENSSPRPSSPGYTSQPTYSGSEDAATYGDDAMRAQEARNLTRRRQLSSPPLVLHAEANNPALTRSDSSRGRRSSISMLPYKNEPSWSLDHSSPPQAQRELQQSERSALGHAPSSSLRHMAAFVAASTPASRPGPGRGHAANSSAGSMSSRDTSPLIPMVHTSSHAGSSASSASFDGPPTPADSIMERFSTVDHPPSATRRSMSVPRILLLGTQEIPAEYEHLLRDRADTIANETDVLNRPPMGSTLSQLPDTGLRGHSPQKLSPILASGPGSFETHSSGPKLISPSARTSEIIHSADFPFVGHIERRTPEQFSADTPSARTSRITSYAASLGHGQPHMTTDSTSPNTHAYTDNLHRSPSGRSWKPSLPASRKASTNSRGMTGSYRRDDEIDQTSIYGMAM